MNFVPIQLEDYLRLHLERNREDKKAEVAAQLRAALRRYKAGKRCACGAPIWVIGSAIAGDMCFTRMTCSTDSSEDYELAEACNKR